MEFFRIDPTELANAFQELPAPVRAMAVRFPANRLYTRRSTGERAIPYSWGEDALEVLTVTGPGRAEPVIVSPDDLVECDLPAGWPPDLPGATVAICGYTAVCLNLLLLPDGMTFDPVELYLVTSLAGGGLPPEEAARLGCDAARTLRGAPASTTRH